MSNAFNETGILEGKYPLKDEFGDAVPPEHFLALFKKTPYYDNVRKFTRRVDNDTGIPFLTRGEYEPAKSILPDKLLDVYENTGIVSFVNDRVYLRGERYFLNHNPILSSAGTDFSLNALSMLEKSLKEDILFSPHTCSGASNAETLEERMIVGSLLDLYKNHMLVLFTGLYESMLYDDNIEAGFCSYLREELEMAIGDYYQLIIVGEPIHGFAGYHHLTPIFDAIRKVINGKGGVYTGKRYLTREFDHPGRMILYASHLLSQIEKKKKKYDLLVNILNGSVEMGLAIQTLDKLLGTNVVIGTTIFQVDFTRHSRIDKFDPDIYTYSDLENVAVPKQLRKRFKYELKGRDVLVIDDNINTGQSLYNIRRALEHMAASVDISAAEVVPLDRVIELIYADNPQANIHKIVKLIESSLTYSPIGWWRDQIELLEENRIPKIIRTI